MVSVDTESSDITPTASNQHQFDDKNSQLSVQIWLNIDKIPSIIKLPVSQIDNSTVSNYLKVIGRLCKTTQIDSLVDPVRSERIEPSKVPRIAQMSLFEAYM